MNKIDIVNQLSEQTNLNHKLAKLVVDTIYRYGKNGNHQR